MQTRAWSCLVVLPTAFDLLRRIFFMALRARLAAGSFLQVVGSGHMRDRMLTILSASGHVCAALKRSFVRSWRDRIVAFLPCGLGMRYGWIVTKYVAAATVIEPRANMAITSSQLLRHRAARQLNYETWPKSMRDAGLGAYYCRCRGKLMSCCRGFTVHTTGTPAA